MITTKNENQTWRKIRAAFRDTWILTSQFGLPLIFYLSLILIGSTLYFFLSQIAEEPIGNFAEAVYQILSLTFFQSINPFPRAWYLEIFFFLMPIISLIFLAQGITEFGVMLFNRRQRGKEWEMAVASTFTQHHILVGLGHLGYRVAANLHQMSQNVVVIEINPSADLVESIKRMGIPVIQDDATREVTLEAAGVSKARSIILCVQNDSLNLQVALKAKHLNKDIKVVVRIFDDDFAYALQDQFGFTAFSATDMAAPAFAAAAAGIEMTRPISIEGQIMSLARLTISPNSTLATLSVSELEANFEVSIVLLRRDSVTDLHPIPETILLGGDTIGVIGGPLEITGLIQENHRA